MFGINDRDIRMMERDLVEFANRAFPFATRKTLNDAAFQTQNIARADVQENFTLRNRFTTQSIRVDRARTLNVRRQSAVVGSTASYMADQEYGGIKSKGGREGVPIATSYSAGLGENIRPRTRLPRRANKMANIQLQRRRRPGSRYQRNIVTIQQASESGHKYVFLDLGRRKGIFKITGRRVAPKIKMVYDMTRRSVAIPQNPWLKPAFDETARMLPAFYADALRFQLRRLNLFTE